MGTNTGHVMTLANSIIGVSVLAMPFCFKQCGIVLACLMLIISSVMTRLACYYLIKSAILARRRNFEFLAFHTFGPTGKLTVELSIIGFMLGTCIAFFVVMGDLGPAILGPVLNIDNPSSIRASVLIAIAMFVVLPLGLLRNVDSLSAISAATIAFYICLVLKVMGEATTHLVAWDWLDKVSLWRPAGLLQCIPIFSMALSCQTQLFEIFDSIPNASLDKMTVIVRSAVNLCTIMYMAMGFFGYIAFCTQPFSGNLMLSFSPTPTSEVIKMGFVLSVAVSFPLVIFPCRASLHSLLFRRGIPPHHELLSVTNHMPETRFKCITFTIVAVSLVTGILIPNIELVLGLVGSTIGVLICIIIPATLFLCVSTKNNNERLLAQILFVMGILIMVLGSYANLYATEEVIAGNDAPAAKSPPVLQPELPAINLLPPDPQAKVQIKDDTLKDIKNVEQLAVAFPKLMKETAAPAVLAMEEKADVRKEPPVPEAPVMKVVSETPNEIKQELKAVPAEEVKIKESPVAAEQPASKKDEVIHGDAIKKEDDEIKEVQKQEILKKKEELIEKLEENEQKQQKLLEEQKKILLDIKHEKEKLVEENKQLKKTDDEPVVKIPKEEKLNVENKIVVDEKQKAPVILNNLADIKRLPIVEENKLKKQIETLPKDNIVNVIKEDVVKKHMADGVPFPIAIKNVVPHFEGIKSAKIVDNPSNMNEDKAESKVLRREILGDGEMKESREKRDIEEVIQVDLKDVNDNLKTLNRVESDQIENISEEKDGKSLSKVKNVSNNDLVEVKEREVLQNALEKETEKTESFVKSKDHLHESPSEKEIPDEQCPDKKKSNVKFSDDLKPLELIAEVQKSVLLDTQVKTTAEVKSKEGGKKEATSTESIIKSPAYLSNPGLVFRSAKLDPGMLENNVNNAVKPMKRDLKSFDMTQHDTSKKTET